MIITYMTLRKCVGWLGVLLVPILVLGTLVLGPPPAIQTSVSAYYYTNMRNPLEGILCAIALFLMCYHGYAKEDSIISKLAGVFCACIAFFPTSDSATKTDPISTLHFIFADIFFTLFGLYVHLSLYQIVRQHDQTKDRAQPRL
jgi:Kef-type K+ transport system membrane component KefB